MSNSNIGVIIGGGGRTVHCNDGPRHHVQLSEIRDCGMGVSVSDYTAQSYIRSNTLSNNSSHIVAAFGAHEVTVERNDMRNAAINPTVAVTPKRSYHHNHITSDCTPNQATLALVNAPTRLENMVPNPQKLKTKASDSVHCCLVIT